MEGSYFYCSVGEEQHGFYDYMGDSYGPTNIKVWSDPDYDEGRSEDYGEYPYEGSSPQQQVWGCCASEAPTSSSDEEQSQPDCPCQHASTTGSEDVSRHSASGESRASSDWETDDGTSLVASSTSGNTCASSADQTDSCRNSSHEISTSSWETALSEESDSSWETTTTCSCEAADESAACQRCRQAEKTPRWDDEPPEHPGCYQAIERMSHPFSEGGGGSGSLVPLSPSTRILRAPPQRRPRPYFRRWKSMTSSSVGRRPEMKKKQAEHKQARGSSTVQKVISAPAVNLIAAQKSSPTQRKMVQTTQRPRRRRFRWNPVQKKIRKVTAIDAVKIGDRVAGPSGKNHRRLRTASCPKAVRYHK